MSSFPDPFRDRPNYDETLLWMAVVNGKGKVVYLSLEDYQRIIADSRSRQEAERGAKPAAKGRAKGQRS